MISPVRSHDREGSPGVEEVLRWEGFVEKVGFEPGVQEWRNDGVMDDESGDDDRGELTNEKWKRIRVESVFQ